MEESSIALVTQFTGEALDSEQARRELSDEQRERIALAQRFMAREGWEPCWMVWAEVPAFERFDRVTLLRHWIDTNAVVIVPAGGWRRLVQLVFDEHWKTWAEHVAGEPPAVAPSSSVASADDRLQFLHVHGCHLDITGLKQSDKLVRRYARDIIDKYAAGTLRVRDLHPLRQSLIRRGVPIEAGVAADRQQQLSNLDWYASRLVWLFENEAWNTDLTNHPHLKSAPDFLDA